MVEVGTQETIVALKIRLTTIVTFKILQVAYLLEKKNLIASPQNSQVQCRMIEKRKMLTIFSHISQAIV